MKAQVLAINSFGKLDIKTIVKSISISYIITFAILLILSFLITYTPISMVFANVGVILTAAISTFFGGFFISRKVKSHGFINGAVAGVFYVVVLYCVGAIVYGKFDFERNMIIMAVISLLSGTFGGITGVNVNYGKKKSKR